MKHSFLLLFILIGLVLLDWGCSRDCDEYETHQITDLIVGIVSTDTSKISKWSYQMPFLVLIPQTERVASVYSYNDGLYASVFWGCEIDTHISYTTEIDSFSIKSDKKYNNSVEQDLSNILMNPYNNKQVNEIELSSVHPLYRLEYGLSEGPSTADTFQLTFKFFDTDGNVFETTTEPIIITP
jgi:hypothetical protein